MGGVSVIRIGGVYATSNQIIEGMSVQEYRNKNGRCIAILLRSIGVRGRCHMWLFEERCLFAKKTPLQVVRRFCAESVRTLIFYDIAAQVGKPRTWGPKRKKVLWTQRANKPLELVRHGLAPMQKRGLETFAPWVQTPFAASPKHFWKIALVRQFPRSAASQKLKI